MSSPTQSASALTPFTARAVESRGWFARTVRLEYPDAAVQAVMNLFTAHDPGGVSPAEALAAAASQGVRGVKARDTLATVYDRAVKSFVADAELSQDEAAYLDRLRIALGISATQAAGMLREAVRPHVEAIVRRAVADRRIDAAERDTLNALPARLGLMGGDVRDMVQSIIAPIVTEELTARIKDRRYSPSDEAAVRDLAAALGVTDLSFDRVVERQLAHLRTLWNIENGTLPVITAPIALQRGEVCHASFPCGWSEYRTRTERIGYSGLSTSIRIAKGVSYRVGTVRPRSVTRTELVELDRGTAYLTSKRVIFDGASANKALRWSALLGVQLYSDALQLEKASGKPPYLMFSDDAEQAELIGVLASELLARA